MHNIILTGIVTICFLCVLLAILIIHVEFVCHVLLYVSKDSRVTLKSQPCVCRRKPCRLQEKLLHWKHKLWLKSTPLLVDITSVNETEWHCKNVTQWQGYFQGLGLAEVKVFFKRFQNPKDFPFYYEVLGTHPEITWHMNKKTSLNVLTSLNVSKSLPRNTKKGPCPGLWKLIL